MCEKKGGKLYTWSAICRIYLHLCCGFFFIVLWKSRISYLRLSSQFPLPPHDACRCCLWFCCVVELSVFIWIKGNSKVQLGSVHWCKWLFWEGNVIRNGAVVSHFYLLEYLGRAWGNVRLILWTKFNIYRTCMLSTLLYGS